MITLTLGCTASDRTRPFADGRVNIPGITLVPVFLPPTELFPRAVGDAPFDVTELSAATQLVQLSRGTARYVALPVFPSRSFRFDSLYGNAESGINEPADLIGRRIGVPEYQMTMAVWLRGILQDHFGIDFRSMQHVTGGVDRPGRKERVPLDLPPEVDCTPAPEGRSLDDLLLAGEIDALMAPSPPSSFRDGDSRVRRLFADSKAAERAYHAATGMFPVMHMVGLRRELQEARPDLATALIAAFTDAKDAAMADLRAMQRQPVLPLSLPWLSNAIDETFHIMGSDPWSYGLNANRREIEALCRYAHEQLLTPTELSTEDVFENDRR
jgi:4,5-dihydroxyphthalate decarboxylase